MQNLSFRSFQPGDEPAFRELNESWIRQYFAIEPKDIEVLGDPVGHILRPGGYIVMAIAADRAVGCCALLAMPERSFEIGKMAVAEEFRGKGVGRKLLARVVELAHEIGAKRLYLETSTKLEPRFCLYESQGFKYLLRFSGAVIAKRSPYARSDLYMEMFLKGDRET